MDNDVDNVDMLKPYCAVTGITITGSFFLLYC